jgi:hypothetical protein
MSKIDKLKLFEYVYDELPENEISEIEKFISQDPEALEIVNEYLFLKQNLKDLPIEISEEVTLERENQNNFINRILKSISKYIAWELRPNLAFVGILAVLGFSIFQFENVALKGDIEINQVILKKYEIAEVEIYFNALQNDKNPKSLSYLKIDNLNKKITEDCLEVKAKVENQSTKLKFCIVGNKYKMVEQTPTIKTNN